METPTPQVRPGASNPEELPDWLSETPEHEETNYCLQVDRANEGLILQEVKCTREEYEHLKRCLGVYRGLIDNSDSPEENEAVNALGAKLRADRAVEPDTADDTKSQPDPPDWLATPDELQYELGVVDWHAANSQLRQIFLTREEYETLRDVLACLRIDEVFENDMPPQGKQVSRVELVNLCSQLRSFLEKAPAIIEDYGHVLAEEED